MSYIALYRKWRPLVFEDVVEQEHVVKTLKHCVITGHTAHAYLFCGTRGTGKTTMAHILSRAINCLEPHDGNPCNKCEICAGILNGSLLDVIEIDAASNNSVDNVREIRDEVVYTPSRAKYKVYIIDEVHMLSTGAFNALLKTLEEPPSHVVFILATTEPHKLPATILSRCQRFDFRRITADGVAERLGIIAASTGAQVEPEALKLISRLSEGAMRDAISLLDQCISTGGSVITYDDVLSLVGIVNETFISETLEAIKNRDIGELIRLVEKLVMDGKDIVKFLSDLVLHYRNLLVFKMSGSPSEVLDMPAETMEALKRQSAYFEKDEIIHAIRELSSLEADVKWSSHPRVLLEVALIKLCEGIAGNRDTDVNERLALLEKRLDKCLAQPRPTELESRAPAGAKAGAGETASPGKKEPQPERAEPPKAIAKGKALEAWPAILNEIKDSGRMALYSYLLDAKALELDGSRIGLVFKEGAGLCKMMVSKAENLEIMQNAVRKVLGRELAIRCVSEEEAGRDKPKAGEKKNDTAEEKARELAAKLEVPLNIIDD